MKLKKIENRKKKKNLSSAGTHKSFRVISGPIRKATTYNVSRNFLAKAILAIFPLGNVVRVEDIKRIVG